MKNVASELRLLVSTGKLPSLYKDIHVCIHCYIIYNWIYIFTVLGFFFCAYVHIYVPAHSSFQTWRGMSSIEFLLVNPLINANQFHSTHSGVQRKTHAHICIIYYIYEYIHMCLSPYNSFIYEPLSKCVHFISLNLSRIELACRSQYQRQRVEWCDMDFWYLAQHLRICICISTCKSGARFIVALRPRERP